MTTRILLVDDHQIMREGLRSLIEREPGLSVVGEAENGRKAVDLAGSLAPDLVILDVSMPDMNGIEAANQIHAATPQIRMIALSIHSDRRFVLQMFRAGASGYLLKDCAFQELARAVQAVMDGQSYLSPSIAGVVVGGFLQSLTADGSPAFPNLTSREREVLQMVAEGKTTKEIAGSLSVSPKTIETHRRQIMEKIHVSSVAELTKYAIREGLTSL